MLAPASHIVVNARAVLAAAALVGADLALAALALVNLKPAAGRGARARLRVPGGSALLIDESYNANGASVRAALAVLRQSMSALPFPSKSPAPCRTQLEEGLPGLPLLVMLQLSLFQRQVCGLPHSTAKWSPGKVLPLRFLGVGQT